MSAHFNALTGQFLLSEQLIPAGSGQHYDLQNGGIVFGDLLVPKLGGTLFDDATLDLNFAENKSLTDSVSGNNLITFTRASSGTYVDSNGLIQSAAVDTPRFDHDPSTGESLGLLVEEARTNLLKYSVDITNWTNASGGSPTITLNATTAPDGSTAGVSIRNTGVTAFLGDNISYIAGKTYTFSGHFKADDGDEVTMLLYSASGSAGQWNNETSNLTSTFDLTNGTYSTSSPAPTTTTITDVGNGWYRCSITATCTISHTSAHQFIRNSNGGTEGLFAWGMQVEEGSFPTSYIPTSGSTVTRAADVATIDNSGSSVFNVDQFTTINKPFGRSSGSTTLTLLPADPASIQRVSVFNQYLSQETINNASDAEDDGFWRWRILGSSFGLPAFSTDGQVTVDWGDGTVETLTTSDHTFTDGSGYHEVGFRLDSGTYFQPNINNNASHDTKVKALGPAPESMRLSAVRAFEGCSKLEAFDATIDVNGNTSILRAWSGCYSLANFPLINTSGVTNFGTAWRGCASLTSFPLIDTSSATTFYTAWDNCNGLISFPLLNTSNVTRFAFAWRDCSSLTSFPANFFDSWTGTPANNCFVDAWDGCSSLTATSVENILNSIDTSGQSAPNSGVDITIDYDAGTGTPSVATAVTNLKSRGWAIILNGVAQ